MTPARSGRPGRWGSEKCLWKSLTRSSFPISGFSGGMELAFGREKKCGQENKFLKTALRRSTVGVV